jgi:hypothetical protein
MHPRRTGGNHHPVKFFALDRFLDFFLTRLGARVHVRGGKSNTGQLSDCLGNPGYLNRTGNIIPAVTNKYSNPHEFGLLVSAY